MAQSSIESFFHKRKRFRIDDIPTKSKVFGQKIFYPNNMQELSLKNKSDNTRCINLIQNSVLKSLKTNNSPGKSGKKIEKRSATPAGLLPNQKTLDSYIIKLKVPFETFDHDTPPRKKFFQSNDLSPVATSSSEKTENARKEFGLVTSTPIQQSNMNDIKNRRELAPIDFQNNINLNKKQTPTKSIPPSPQKKPFKLPIKLPVIQRRSCTKQLVFPTDLILPSSSKTAYQSPIKKIPPPPKKRPYKSPEFQRRSCARELFPTGLILPDKHRSLLKIFQIIDDVASNFFNKKETLTFSKLKTGIHKRHNFTKRHLSQIKKVMPDYYRFTYEKSKKIIQSNSSKYELVITPVLIEKENNNVDESQAYIGSKILEARKNGFENALILDVKKHHSEYLLSLDQPLILSQDYINSWHISFDVNSVPEISPDETLVSSTGFH